jgi:cytochrome c biogenesis protein CcmG, thiol:disulfide interchange protein DsbE
MDIMIRIVFTLIFTAFLSSLFAQTQMEFPDVELETTKDRIINSSSFKLSQHPKIVVFWVTTSRNAIQELNQLELKNASWYSEFDAQIISIALDNAKQKKKVVPFVRSNGWTFDCYMDPSAKTMIALDGKDVPLTVILDETGKIVWRHEGFDSTTIQQIQEYLVKMTEQ